MAVIGLAAQSCVKASAAAAAVGGVGVIISVVPLTNANIAKKSSNPNLCVGETDTDQQRSNTAEVAKVNITVQSATTLACLLASRFLTSIEDIVDGIFRG